MNKWVERTVFLNILMLFFFVIADYFSWIWIYNGLQPLEGPRNLLTDLHFSTNYWILFRDVRIDGVQDISPYSHLGFSFVFNIPNLPLLVFVITIILNMLLIIKATRETEKTTLLPPPKP
jgi:hypothetical protein